MCDVVRFTGYWGGGETIAKARAEFKKQAKRYPSAKAVWCIVVGEGASKATLDEDAILHYPKTCKRLDI